MKWLERIQSWFGGTIKSNNSFGVGLRSVLSGSAAGGWASDHREETAHFTGFNYIAIHAIASQVAAATVTVFADGDQPYLRKSRRKSLAATAGTFSRWKSTYGADDRTTDPLPLQHPLVQLLKQPNPQESGAHFRYRQAQQLRLTGTCLIWNVPGQTGATCERYVIPTAMATPVAPTHDLPRGGWRINPVASRYTPIVDDGYVDCPSWYRILGQVVDAKQVQVIRLPHAWYLDDGQSPLSAGAKWVDAGEAVDDARYHQLRNGIDPSVVWNLPPDVSPDQDEIDRVQAKISAKYGGPQNVGRVMIAQSGTTVTPLSMSPKDMCYAEGFQDFKAAVLALHQTPPVAVGLQEPGAYAAYNASMKAWRHAAVQPLCDMLAEADTEYLAPQFGDGLTIELESDAVEDAELLESQLQNDLAAGVRTRNEWRAIRGLPPLPDPLGSQIVGTNPTSSAESSTSNESFDDPDFDTHDDSPDPPRFKATSPRLSLNDNESAENWESESSDNDGSENERPGSSLAPKRNRTELIAEILYGLLGPDAISILEADSESDRKSFDPSLHPRDELGRFTRRGDGEAVEAARQVISSVMRNDISTQTLNELPQALDRLTNRQLEAVHREHGVTIPSRLREHLIEHVETRLPPPIGIPPDELVFSRNTGSPKIHVFIQDEKTAQKIIGRQLKKEEWGELVGAQPGARVHVYPYSSGVKVAVEHHDYLSQRLVRQYSIENEFFTISPDARVHGLGTKIVSEQVNKAKELGYQEIFLGAGGNGKAIESSHEYDHDYGGFYAWARMGFDGLIAPLMQNRRSGTSSERASVRDFEKRFPGVKKVSEMMLTPERRLWWQTYGGPFDGTFRLRNGSMSLRILKKYQKERAKRSGQKALMPLNEFPNLDSTDLHIPTQSTLDCSAILSQEDEEILDNIWLEIGRESGLILEDVSTTDDASQPIPD